MEATATEIGALHRAAAILAPQRQAIEGFRAQAGLKPTRSLGPLTTEEQSRRWMSKAAKAALDALRREVLDQFRSFSDCPYDGPEPALQILKGALGDTPHLADEDAYEASRMNREERSVQGAPTGDLAYAIWRAGYKGIGVAGAYSSLLAILRAVNDECIAMGKSPIAIPEELTWLEAQA